MLKQYNESCYLGLLFETNISDYELDVYAHISHTRYKYILIKNEQHLILKKIGQLCGTLQVMGGGIAGNQMNQQARMQINKLTIEKHTQDNEVKNFLRQLHLVHVQTLLNPFFDEEYAAQDDCQRFEVFTKTNEQMSGMESKDRSTGPTNAVIFKE